MEKLIYKLFQLRLRKETVEKLKRIGRKGETYDDVINRLMKGVAEAEG